MTPARSPISYADAEIIAADLAKRWHAITGQAGEDTPAPEQLADLVQWVGRKITEMGQYNG